MINKLKEGQSYTEEWMPTYEILKNTVNFQVTTIQYILIFMRKKIGKKYYYSWQPNLFELYLR